MANENHKHNGDPLEEFFRSHSEQYDIAYNEDDWLKLEKRLDAADAQRNRRRIGYWIAAASLLLFGLFGYYIFQNSQQINRINQQLAEQTSPASPPQEVRPEDESENDEQNSVTGTSSADNQKNLALEENQQNLPDPVNDSTTSLPPDQKNDDSRQQVVAAVTDSSSSETVANQKVAGLFKKEMVCYGCAVSRPGNTSWDPITFLMASNSSDLSTEETSSKQPQITDRPPLGSSNNGSTNAASPLAIGLAVGPDLSTVGSLSHFSKPGYLIGVGIEYQLTQNIAIKTGVARADVRYTAYGSDYQPPAGYWTNGIVADETMARCAILEIPLALKFNVWELKKSRIFATGGISSYIMLNEEYEFNYDDPGYGLADSWSGNTGTRHWFSNAVFSVGYELDLLPATSLRIEPFIKLPVKEVGWGHVKLFSTGTSISLNLRL